MDNLLPPDLRQAVWSFVTTLAFACMGRLGWHVRQVQKRERKFWSTHLLWELPTALASGFVADGIGEYFHLDPKPATAVVIMVSYLGPAGIQALLTRLVDRFVDKG
ncbi:MAG: hypothetical protein E6Q98_02925 [Rhodospirillaceae bacterium]|nr:MAG: hypothetical protein E6Q98_02925 [Rhodospirillaceae bacterium]